MLSADAASLNGLQGRVAFVTEADSGVGRSVALALAVAGANVSVNSREAQRGEEVAAKARRLGVRVTAVPGGLDPRRRGRSSSCGGRGWHRPDRCRRALLRCSAAPPRGWHLGGRVATGPRAELFIVLLPGAVVAPRDDRARFRQIDRSECGCRRPGQKSAHAAVWTARAALTPLVKVIAAESGAHGVTAKVASPAITEDGSVDQRPPDVLRDLLDIPRPSVLDQFAGSRVSVWPHNRRDTSRGRVCVSTEVSSFESAVG